MDKLPPQDNRVLILKKLNMVWLTIFPNLTLGQVMTRACASAGLWRDVWCVDDEILEKFLDREIARFTSNA